MSYEWGRFVWWLQQNSAAVQALTAIVTALLTATLIAITYWYARATREQLSFTAKQFALSTFPRVVFSARVNAYIGEVMFKISNESSYDLKLLVVSFTVWTKQSSRVGQVHELRNRILPANGGIVEETFDYPEEFRPQNDEEVKKFESSLTMHVQFTDLADITVHSFWYSETSGYRYRSDLKDSEGESLAHWYTFMDAGGLPAKVERSLRERLKGKRRYK